MCIININIYHVHMGLCRKVEKWFDGLNFGFSHLHDYLGLHDYPGLKSNVRRCNIPEPNFMKYYILSRIYAPLDDLNSSGEWMFKASYLKQKMALVWIQCELYQQPLLVVVSTPFSSLERTREGDELKL